MLSLSLLTVLAAASTDAQTEFLKKNEWVLDYETGALYVFRNVQRYGENGNWFNAKDVGEQRSLLLNQRASVELTFKERHFFSFLYAPIDIVTEARLPNQVVFRDETFAAGTPIKFRYLFDGWRATYQYKLVKGTRWEWNVGAALQIRSASVEMSGLNGEQFVYDSDIGLVPALSTRIRYTADSGLYAMFDASGSYVEGFAGGGQGGVLDAALTLGVPVHRSLDLIFRLRQYGGGATVPNRDIGNWGWYGSAVAGVRVNLSKIGKDN